jgi:hypothetical protein
MVELIFLNIDDPSHLLEPRNRMLVRSHITRRQHERKRNALLRSAALEPVRLQKQGQGVEYRKLKDDVSLSSPGGIDEPVKIPDREADCIVKSGHLAQWRPGM